MGSRNVGIESEEEISLALQTCLYMNFLQLDAEFLFLHQTYSIIRLSHQRYQLVAVFRDAATARRKRRAGLCSVEITFRTLHGCKAIGSCGGANAKSLNALA